MEHSILRLIIKVIDCWCWWRSLSSSAVRVGAVSTVISIDIAIVYNPQISKLGAKTSKGINQSLEGCIDFLCRPIILVLADTFHLFIEGSNGGLEICLGLLCNWSYLFIWWVYSNIVIFLGFLKELNNRLICYVQIETFIDAAFCFSGVLALGGESWNAGRIGRVGGLIGGIGCFVVGGGCFVWSWGLVGGIGGLIDDLLMEFLSCVAWAVCIIWGVILIRGGLIHWGCWVGSLIRWTSLVICLINGVSLVTGLRSGVGGVVIFIIVDVQVQANYLLSKK